MRFRLLLVPLLSMVFVACNTLDPALPGNLVPPTVEDDPDLPSMAVNNTLLHVERFGDPDLPKLFVLEGGPGDDFIYLLDLLQRVDGYSLTDDYHVIYHDYRGCGLSRRHPLEELTMEESLRDLEGLVDALAPGQEVYFIGHSHGGVVATQFLNRHPARVAGAVLIEPGALSVALNEQLPAANDVNVFGQDVNRILWAKQLIGQGNHAEADYYYGVARINIDADNRGESCPSRTRRGGAAAAIAIAIREVNDGDYDFTTNLSAFTQPVLFISSDESDLGVEFQAAFQVPLFADARHEVVTGTGHNGLINCTTERTLRLIRGYLESL